MKTFEEFIQEMSSADFNAHLSLTPKHNEPASSKDADRHHEVYSAAYKHVSGGDHKKAYSAAYAVAHKHATQDRNGPATAHDIADRRARMAVKKAREVLHK